MITLNEYRKAIRVAEEDMAKANAAREPINEDRYDEVVVKYLNSVTRTRNKATTREQAEFALQSGDTFRLKCALERTLPFLPE